MSRYIDGQDRTQSVLFPERLDDWIDEDNPVRVIDVFVDELDLAQLGFERAEPAATGRPAYHPATLLKIYVYGYLNRVQSSRRLEREAQRNVELMWLTGRLARTSRRSPTSAGTTARRSARCAASSCCCAASSSLFERGDRGDRRQQVQGGQQPRQELHARTSSRRAWSRSTRASSAT